MTKFGVYHGKDEPFRRQYASGGEVTPNQARWLLYKPHTAPGGIEIENREPEPNATYGKIGNNVHPDMAKFESSARPSKNVERGPRSQTYAESDNNPTLMPESESKGIFGHATDTGADSPMGRALGSKDIAGSKRVIESEGE